MKTHTFSNNLTDSEMERLALLMEECSETIHVIGKILRHGYGSHNPFDEKKTPNRELLNKELGDVMLAVRLMSECDDINMNAMSNYCEKKRKSIKKYLHHNTPPKEAK